jgi:simple sugar transport system permease protein
MGAISSAASQLGIVSIGVTILMISGEFDLSVGAVFAIASFIFAQVIAHTDPVTAVFVTLAFCAGIGLLNGLIAIKLRIGSFITTLGTFFVFTGVLLYVTNGLIITINASPSVVAFLNSFSGPIPGTFFRLSLFWFAGLAVFFQIVLTKTRYGNWIFATGGNVSAARAVGINTDRVKIGNFMLTSLLAGFSGVLEISLYLSVTSSIGSEYQLESIAATVIGGTSLFGGVGSVIGSVIGSFTISQISDGLIFVGVPGYAFDAFTGVILIVAVVFYNQVRRRFITS